MPDLTVVIFLLLAAFAAGWVDAIGGGGGLIQFPALLLVFQMPHLHNFWEQIKHQAYLGQREQLTLITKNAS